jgi:hypothetical protein
MGHPNELPEGGEGGGGGVHVNPGEFPQELPVDSHLHESISQLLREVLVLKQRINVLESNHLTTAITTRAGIRGTGIGGPNELPEGGEGGGGFGGIHPGEFPQELPVDYTTHLSQITDKLSAIERSVLGRISDLERQIGHIAQR